ncbi:MAG: UDP-3-O-acyl-N-acetylglucosamine deacetylase [Nitrospiraceae bacterium]|nr:UDP-3-O-acyl-N-acetylglucosamine deacetylase [Nitrospiraceae bacterium]
MIRFQRTLKNSVSCEGVGLHSGRKVHLTLRPADAGTGVVFHRTDLGNRMIEAVAAHTVATSYATTLRKSGATVGTVEHVLGALAGIGISNAIVELDGDEVPIMDGSAGPFVRMIAEAGVQVQDRVQPVLKITRPVLVREGAKQLAIWPSESQGISCAIDFDHPLLREQSLNYQYSEENFIRDVADARTFGFLRDVETLKAKGLARGGSLENAVVLGEDSVLNREGLRYRDEFVRHKVLDMIGDLSLAGMPVIGHVIAHKPGHSLNAVLVGKLLQNPLNWVMVGDPAPAARREAVYQDTAAL